MLLALTAPPPKNETALSFYDDGFTTTPLLNETNLEFPGRGISIGESDLPDTKNRTAAAGVVG